MVQISAISRLAIEQLKDLSDSTKNFLVLPQNQINTQVVNAFNNSQIGINENTTSHIVTQKLTNGVATTIQNPLSMVPQGISAINSDGATVAYIVLAPQSSSSSISVTAYFDTVITDWQAYTPTITGLPVSTNTAFARQVNDTLEVQTAATASGAATANITLGLPSGLAIDYTKLAADPNALVGYADASNGTDFPGSVITNGGANSVLFSVPHVWNATVPFTWASGNLLTSTFAVPIKGWGVTNVSANVTFILWGS